MFFLAPKGTLSGSYNLWLSSRISLSWAKILRGKGGVLGQGNGSAGCHKNAPIFSGNNSQTKFVKILEPKIHGLVSPFKGVMTCNHETS